MKFRLFNLLTSFSLLLCIAVLALWADSQFTARRVSRQSDFVDTMLISDSGKIELATTRIMAANDGPASWRIEAGPARVWGGGHLLSRLYGHFGFGHLKYSYFATVEIVTTETWVPHWFVVVLTSILPAIWTLRRLRKYLAARRARLVGLCPQCGYDLRATPQRCPECAHIPAAVPA